MNELGAALARMVAAVRIETGELPRYPFEHEIDPSIYVGEPDADRWCQWQPLAMPPGPSLSELAPDLGPFHPSIEAHYGTWWFLELADAGVSLDGNWPGEQPAELLERMRSRQAGMGSLEYVPIGIESQSGLQVVVHNTTGEVAIEDIETNTYRPLASSLNAVYSQLWREPG